MLLLRLIVVELPSEERDDVDVELKLEEDSVEVLVDVCRVVVVEIKDVDDVDDVVELEVEVLGLVVDDVLDVVVVVVEDMVTVQC